MAEGIGALKEFLRIDADMQDDNALIQSLGSAAISYLEQTTGKRFRADAEVMALAQKQLVLHWYENRSAFSTKTNLNELPNHLQAIITHISLAGAYEPLSNGGTP